MPSVWEAEAIRGQEIAQQLASEESYDAARTRLDSLPPEDKRAVGLYAIYVQRVVSIVEQETSRQRLLSN